MAHCLGPSIGTKAFILGAGVPNHEPTSMGRRFIDSPSLMGVNGGNAKVARHNCLGLGCFENPPQVFYDHRNINFSIFNVN